MYSSTAVLPALAHYRAETGFARLRMHESETPRLPKKNAVNLISMTCATHMYDVANLPNCLN